MSTGRPPVARKSTPGGHQRRPVVLTPQVFVADLATGVRQQVTYSAVISAGRGRSSAPQLSADGNVVVFAASVPHLAPGGTGRVDGIYLARRLLIRRQPPVVTLMSTPTRHCG